MHDVAGEAELDAGVNIAVRSQHRPTCIQAHPTHVRAAVIPPGTSLAAPASPSTMTASLIE